jgi:hypothetical protein
VRLDPLTPGQVIDHWDRLIGFVLQMERRFPDDWPVREFVRQVDSGEMSPWLAYEPDNGKAFAIVGTAIRVKPTGRRFLSIVYASGIEHRQWLRMMIARVEEHAREKECEFIEVFGRSGWAKQLFDFAIVESMGLFHKELV